MALRRSRQRGVITKLLSLLVRYPWAKVLCVSSGEVAPCGLNPRSLKHAGYFKEASIIIIEYYE